MSRGIDDMSPPDYRRHQGSLTDAQMKVVESYNKTLAVFREFLLVEGRLLEIEKKILQNPNYDYEARANVSFSIENVISISYKPKLQICKNCKFRILVQIYTSY